MGQKVNTVWAFSEPGSFKIMKLKISYSGAQYHALTFNYAMKCNKPKLMQFYFLFSLGEFNPTHHLKFFYFPCILALAPPIHLIYKFYLFYLVHLIYLFYIFYLFHLIYLFFLVHLILLNQMSCSLIRL